jgi:hypothetical protein
MIFNFYIEHLEGGADFGICSADSIEEAEGFIKIRFAYYESDEGYEKPTVLNIEHGVEDLINEQYGGLALLTSESSR